MQKPTKTYKDQHAMEGKIIMTKRLLLLIGMIALLVSGLPALAQDVTPEPPPNCPTFEGESRDIRTSYYIGEGTAYLSSNQFSNAELSFTCVIRVIDPNYVAAYLGRGAVYSGEHSYDAAIKDYSKAIDLDGSSFAAYNNRGVIYTAMQDYDKAAADFDKVMSLNADYIPGYNNRSIVYAIQGDYDKALELLQSGISRSGIDKVLAQYQDPKRPADADPIPFDPLAARAYALMGIIYSARSLDNYQKYLYLYDRAGKFPDERIQSASGALESQFTFDMRLDDGTWMLSSDFSPSGG
jgi:tetratricopeptide (TPR) repeat protein